MNHIHKTPSKPRSNQRNKGKSTRQISTRSHVRKPHKSSPIHTLQQQHFQTDLIDEKPRLNKDTGPVRVRFAPSPTGTLHLGGLRTALYNLLFVKKRGGEMILRIEDTDRNRLVPGAVDSLINDMRWCGIVYDEGPNGIHIHPSRTFAQKLSPNTPISPIKSNPAANPQDNAPYTQSERFHLYQQGAEKLLKSKNAYHCFCTAERLDQVRESRAARGEPIIYDKLCSSLSEGEVEDKKAKGEKFVIRMKMPEDGITATSDLVRGDVRFQNNLIDDQVLIKSDGFPTYHLANIIDDHMMGITHVIRGEEWLPSLPKHIQLYHMFGWEAPQFAHLPLLLREDGGKLSKRFRDSSLNYYVEMGYLPEAIINFVALLGWHPTLEEMQLHADKKGSNTVDPSAALIGQTVKHPNAIHSASKTQDAFANTLTAGADVTNLDPAVLKALLTDDKTKLKQKTTKLAQSTTGGGGSNEVFTVDELADFFNINNIQKSGATVELSKLKFFHSQHWKRALISDINRLEAFAAPFVHNFITKWKNGELSEEDRNLLDGVEFTEISSDPTITSPGSEIGTDLYQCALQGSKDGMGMEYRANHAIVTALKTTRDHPYTLAEFPARSMFAWARPNLTTEHASKVKDTFWINNTMITSKQPKTTPQILNTLISVISNISDDDITSYNVGSVVDRFKTVSKKDKIGLKDIYLPLRFCFTGSTAGPGVADQLCAIGKDEAIKRIKTCLEQYQ